MLKLKYNCFRFKLKNVILDYWEGVGVGASTIIHNTLDDELQVLWNLGFELTGQEVYIQDCLYVFLNI